MNDKRSLWREAPFGCIPWYTNDKMEEDGKPWSRGTPHYWRTASKMLPGGTAARSIPRGLPGNHLFPIDELLRFVGATTRIPSAMFPRPWKSKPGKLAEILFASYYFVTTLLTCKGKLLIYSLTPDMLLGETVLVDTNIRGNILRCMRSFRTFCVVRTNQPHPVARACAMLGIDATTDLTAFLTVNSLILFFARREGRPAVVHLATFPNGQKLIAKHRYGLEIANSGRLPASLHSLIPELISFVTGDGYSILIQSRLPCAPLVLPTSEIDFYAAMHQALEPLLEFRAAAAPGAEGPDAELVFRQFPALPERWPEFSNIHRPLIARLQAWQRERNMTPILTHGDYWHRNILFDPAKKKLCGILDWDRARLDGIPGADALYLVMSSLSERKSEEICEILEQTWTGNWESQLLEAYIERIKAAYNLNADDIAHLGLFTYLDEFYKQSLQGAPFRASRLEKLRKLIPSIETWLARSGVDYGRR